IYVSTNTHGTGMRSRSWKGLLTPWLEVWIVRQQLSHDRVVNTWSYDLTYVQIVNFGDANYAPAPLGNRWAAGREERVNTECLVASNLARLILPAKPPNILVVLRDVAAKTPDQKLRVSQVRALPCDRTRREVAHLPGLQTEAAAIYGEETANHIV